MRQVLVIDDDDLNREVLGLLLTEQGCHVEGVESGEQAVELLSSAGRSEGEIGPEVILMDMQMPGICGQELTRRLRLVCRAETMVIAMSGNRPAPAELEGSDGFLSKPFSMEEFHQLVAAGSSHEQPSTATQKEGSRDGAAPVLELEIFASFEAMLSGAGLEELYSLCVRDAEKQLTRMEVCAQEGDDAKFRQSAHANKGSLGMLGARELEGLCAELERSGLAGDYLASLTEFPEAIERLRRMLMARGVELRPGDPGA